MSYLTFTLAPEFGGEGRVRGAVERGIPLFIKEGLGKILEQYEWPIRDITPSRALPP